MYKDLNKDQQKEVRRCIRAANKPIPKKANIQEVLQDMRLALRYGVLQLQLKIFIQNE